VRTLANLGMAGVAGVDLTAMLDDQNPEVRAEAAISIPGLEVTQRAIDRLVAMLDGEPRERWAAADALLRIGEPAVDAILRHLDAGPGHPEVALRVAAGLRSGRLLPAALAWCRDSRPAVRVRAASAVAAVGGEAAAQCLVGLLEDDAAPVRGAAARGLGLLEHWPAAGALARLLGDPVWEVRRSAAQSLRMLGPAGRLHLRRAAGDPDERVAEIARHVTDLPPSAVEALR
jgi:HEAT repeat protein